MFIFETHQESGDERRVGGRDGVEGGREGGGEEMGGGLNIILSVRC